MAWATGHTKYSVSSALLPFYHSLNRHKDGEIEGVALRLAVSLTKGGGLDVSPSGMGHEASTLMRDVLQGHLMHYDFYTQGAPPPLTPSPRTGAAACPNPQSIYPRHPPGPRLKNRQRS